MTLPSPTELPLIRARAEARHAAMRRLKENHQVEYDALHAEERLKRGLPAQPNSASIDDLKRQNAALRELLSQNGIEPT